MLMSVLNENLNQWEIKNFEAMPNVPRETENTGTQLKMSEQAIDVEAKEAYEQLRAEAVPPLFTTGFLKASKTMPMYNIVLDLLRSGQSPYEVIEWLTCECSKAQQELQRIVIAQTHPAHY